jgi:uncharacterized protein GlcG (DUF336 family)
VAGVGRYRPGGGEMTRAGEARVRTCLTCLALALSALLGACGGGGSGSAPSTCTANCGPVENVLTVADIERILTQAIFEAQARGMPATIAVVDRVGNVLAVYQMAGTAQTVAISSGLGVVGGLDGIAPGTIPATQATISMAITGAFLSSQGNAFTTRTASQIIQLNFNPQEANQPSGPLFGVQFSQLTCSDVNRKTTDGTVGPKRSPLGLAANPGGLPLYKNGTLVGGVAAISNGLYTLDLDITDVDTDPNELIAEAATSGFAAPADQLANRITADGRTFRYVDSTSLASDPARAPSFASLPAAVGALVPVAGYNAGTIVAGTAFLTPASGIRADNGALAAIGGYVLVDRDNVNRFPPRASSVAGGLDAADVTAILGEALKIASRARAQIRRPLGSAAEVTISVVDLNGDILGLARTRDGPVFGIDVSAQKARTALLISSPTAAARLSSLPDAVYLAPPGQTSSIAAYVLAARAFLGDPLALTGGTAWSARGVGNLHRPTFPDGIYSTPNGPFSKPVSSWSPFNVGFQLDLVYNQLVKGVLGDTSEGCAGRLPAGSTSVAPDAGLPVARNGVQIFAGGVPVYRGNTLIGAVGVSGDGIDQDDMIAFLGVANAAQARSSGFANAPAAMRDDNLVPQGTGTRLRYVQCPQSPFNGSTEQNVCAGL